MSENTEPVATEYTNPVQLSHGRILWAMAIVVLLGAITSSIFVSLRFGAGFTIGGILAFVNYYWLKNSLKKIFDSAAGGEKPSFLSLNYFLRYAAVGLVIYIIYLSEVVPIIAVLLGLGVFAAGIVIEGLILIFSSISKREEF
ncbi:MAG: ATP synthase subunit I [Pyrinomonadaceae bacterium]